VFLLFIPSAEEILTFRVGVEMPASCTQTEKWRGVTLRCHRAGHVALCSGAEWLVPLGFENPESGPRIPCKFPDTPIKFPVPSRREFT
jgi:hypothetical protein